MNANRNSLRVQLLNEIIDELHKSKSDTLDDFLLEAGFDPEHLLRDFEDSIRLFEAKAGRRMFEAARATLRSESKVGEIFILETDKKHSVFAAIKKRMEMTGEMTIAARNQKIASEEDLDRFLEACFELGIIDEKGELKD